MVSFSFSYFSGYPPETIITVDTDLRSISTSLSDRVLVAIPSKSSKISDLIKLNYTVPEDCYSEALTIPQNNIDNWTIYPNPFRTSFFVIDRNQIGETNFELRNQLSQIVLKGDLKFTNGKTSINAAMLENGMYFLTLKNSVETSSHKIIKY